jgi:hypothetical protein
MSDFINYVIILICLLVIVKLGYEFINPKLKVKKNKMSKSDFYKLVTINLLPFFIYELYKKEDLFNKTHPLHSKIGEILVILFCYILYLEVVYPLVI